MRQSNFFQFGPSRAEMSRQRKQDAARRRAEAKRRKADERRARRQLAAQLRRRRKEDARWRRQERKRRLRDDKRRKVEQKRLEKQQRRAWLGGGMLGSRRSAGGRRAAQNLLRLAAAIGVRLDGQDQQQLIDYADQQLAGSGDDLFSVYNQLIGSTSAGQKVRYVVQQYAIDNDQQELNPNTGLMEPKVDIVTRIMQAADGLARLQGRGLANTQQAIQSAETVTEALGAPPEDIRKDQNGLVQDEGWERYLQYVSEGGEYQAQVEAYNSLPWYRKIITPRPEPLDKSVFVDAARQDRAAYLNRVASEAVQENAALQKEVEAAMSEDEGKGIIGWLRRQFGATE